MSRAKPGYRLGWATTKTRRFRCSASTARPHLERRRVVVGLGWGWPDTACWLWAPLFAVLSAFGGDAVGAVLGAGAPAFGHHRGALGAVIQR